MSYKCRYFPTNIKINCEILSKFKLLEQVGNYVDCQEYLNNVIYRVLRILAISEYQRIHTPQEYTLHNRIISRQIVIFHNFHETFENFRSFCDFLQRLATITAFCRK